MDAMDDFGIFLAAPPGLEGALADEARAARFAVIDTAPGGVRLRGGWPEVWRANLELRGAGRVLARVAEFRAFHLAQLDKRSRKVDWAKVLRPDVAVTVEAVCRRSKIYHAGAATERVARAIAGELGAPVVTRGPAKAHGPEAESDLPQVPARPALRVLVRIEDDLVTISVDTSGDALHKRGHKTAVGKAPMRETLAALFLRQCGYDGTEPVVDPMCGSGTFVIEAAEWAAGLMPGRSRVFAFEHLAGFDAGAWAAMRSAGAQARPVALRFHGYDRDQGAVAMATANAARAGGAGVTVFARQAVSDLAPPDGPPGLVIVNPPYGARIGERKLLFALYGALGQVLRERFRGWRAGVVTSDGGLAKATGLPFLPPGPPVAHGGLKVTLHRTGRLG